LGDPGKELCASIDARIRNWDVSLPVFDSLPGNEQHDCRV
jgi:hypothetical protein